MKNRSALNRHVGVRGVFALCGVGWGVCARSPDGRLGSCRVGAPCAADKGLQERLCGRPGSIRGVRALEPWIECGRKLCVLGGVKCFLRVGWGNGGHSPGAGRGTL